MSNDIDEWMEDLNTKFPLHKYPLNNAQTDKLIRLFKKTQVYNNTTKVLEIPLCKHGVYFLIKNSIIVYIGMSVSCIRTRVSSHRGDKIFDSYRCVYFENKKVNKNEERIIIGNIEKAYISLFGNPAYNKLSRLFGHATDKNPLINDKYEEELKRTRILFRKTGKFD